MTMIHGNFIGATIVCIINLILLDSGSFKPIGKTPLKLLNILLDLLIIVFMGLAFKDFR